MYYKNLLFLLLSCFISFIGTAQIYPDHFGTGNGIGVTVISSNLNSDNTATNTINGTELIPDTIGAARFLAQAVFGGNMDDIAHVTQIGIDQWLDEQMNMPYKTYATVYDDVYNGILVRMDTSSLMYPPNEEKWSPYLTLTFFQKVFTEEDILRQKMAFALSQIFVIAYEIDGPLRNRGEGYASYYDVLYEGAFGNFEDMLRKVTLHPLMGRYLSHYKNKAADSDMQTQPDENYAREIMQLFTIGLHELNNDGTPKLDVECNPIPTYGIEDIQEMAKVFTGFIYGSLRYNTVAKFNWTTSII